MLIGLVGGGCFGGSGAVVTVFREVSETSWTPRCHARDEKSLSTFEFPSDGLFLDALHRGESNPPMDLGCFDAVMDASGRRDSSGG